MEINISHNPLRFTTCITTISITTTSITTTFITTTSNLWLFPEVCKLTDVFEGSIIRVLRRLEELLRQLAAAATAIGNSELTRVFSEGSTRIRRGVVFAASLYL